VDEDDRVGCRHVGLMRCPFQSRNRRADERPSRS
jgi:hypothetical protein